MVYAVAHTPVFVESECGMFGYKQVSSAAQCVAVADPNRVDDVYHYIPGSGDWTRRYLDGTGCPNCFVGVVMANLGVEDTQLAFLDECHDGRGCSVGCSETVGKFACREFWYANFTIKALEFLRFLQSHQDSGYSWGLAFRLAEKIHRN